MNDTPPADVGDDERRILTALRHPMNDSHSPAPGAWTLSTYDGNRTPTTTHTDITATADALIGRDLLTVAIKRGVPAIAGGGKPTLRLTVAGARLAVPEGKCPGCLNPLETPEWCYNCHFFDLVVGRAHYCGRPGCSCPQLQHEIPTSVLDAFLPKEGDR